MHTIPDSPDALIRLWSAAPPSKPTRPRRPTQRRRNPLAAKLREVRRPNRRPFGWDRLAGRVGVPPRVRWASFARAQVRQAWTLERFLPLLRPWLEAKARSPYPVVARVAAESLASLARQCADRRPLGLRWFRDRWLPDAAATARLREVGLA